MNKQIKKCIIMAVIFVAFVVAVVQKTTQVKAEVTVWCDCPCGVWCSQCSTMARSCTYHVIIDRNMYPNCKINDDCVAEKNDPYSCYETTCCSNQAQSTACPYNQWQDSDNVTRGHCYNGDCNGTTVGCNQACGGSVTCSGGNDCIGGVCRNPSCDSKTNCTCDGEPPTPSCNVTVSGTNPVVAGTAGSYTASISMNNSTAQSLTMSLGTSSTSMNGPGSPVTVSLTAPTVPGTYTLSASVTGSSSVSCSGTATITVIDPVVTVTARACNSTNMLDCTACTDPTGFRGTFSLHSYTTPETTRTEAANGNTPASFSSVSGGDIANNLILTASDANEWTVLGSGTNSYPAGTWSTAGETYGPYNFCVTQNHDPWWQIFGGDGYAHGVSAVSTPGTTLSLMNNYGGSTVSSGVLSAGTAIDTTDTIVGPTGRSWAVEGSRYTTPPKEGFEYFVRSFELGSAPAADTYEGGLLPEGTPANTGKEVYYLNDDVSIDTAIHITGGTFRTYLIDGSLNINADITVDQGGFLAFVTSQPITVSGNVSQLHGIYITNSTFSVADGAGSGVFSGATGRRLEVEGTVVAWSSTSLLRDLGGLNNNSYPATIFTYRPDFLINLPSGFKHNGIQWREVAP